MSRNITRTVKDEEGDIIAIGGAWGQEFVQVAIGQIESGEKEYRIGDTGVHPVHRVDGVSYLRSDPDGNTGNNLDNLPSS